MLNPVLLWCATRERHVEMLEIYIYKVVNHKSSLKENSHSAFIPENTVFMKTK